MRFRVPTLLAMGFSAMLLMTACGSTSTPDLKLIMILSCGSNNDDCSVEADKTCEGRSRWDALMDHNEIVIYDNGDKKMKTHDLSMGTFDEATGSCTFNETISVKSTARYRIFIDDLGPFDITKSTLEKQNWTAVLEFNN